MKRKKKRPPAPTLGPVLTNSGVGVSTVWGARDRESPDALFPQRGREMLFTLPAFPTCHTHTFRLSPSMNGCVEAHLPALPILRADVFSHTLPSFAHDCFLLSCFFSCCRRRVWSESQLYAFVVRGELWLLWERPHRSAGRGRLAPRRLGMARAQCVFFFNSERRPPFCHMTRPVLAICQRN